MGYTPNSFCMTWGRRGPRLEDESMRRKLRAMIVRCDGWMGPHAL